MTQYGLEVGKTYKLTTANNQLIVALTEGKGDRALFMHLTESEVCKFVSWRYKVIGDDKIECANGNYFRTLDEAMKYENRG